MMKRIAILMIILLITGFCFASGTETSVTIQYDADSPFESAEVSADLSLKPSSSFSYKVGFTTSGSSYNSPVATIPLTPAIDTEQSTFTFEPLTEIYVYWDIFGTAPFRLMLGATGPLTTENSESFIGWKISRLDGEGVTITCDLIPEDYFKLRHFPEKGLNPAPYSEKKNDWTDIGSMSEQKSNSTSETSVATLPKKTDVRLQKSTVLILLSAFFLSFFVVVHTSQNIVSESTSKQSTLFELVYNSTDSKGVCVREATKAITEIDKKTEKEIIKKKAKAAVYIKQHTSINVVKYGFLAISALLISIIFIPLCRKEYAYCGIGSFALAFLILTLSPIALSVAFFALVVLLGLLLSLISIGALNLIEFVKAYQNMPWYQKRKDLFYDEDAGIRKVEPNAERSFEEGKLVYTVITDKHITRQEHTLAYQMIYSTNYINDGSIRIYFIMPELAEMFTSENGLKSSYVKIDDNGDMYLEFASEDKRMSGAETIKHLYKWVDSYNRHRAGDGAAKSEKL